MRKDLSLILCFSGEFEFSPAKNGGVEYFNVDYLYRPFSPYIHVTPNFGGLYGKDFNDAIIIWEFQTNDGDRTNKKGAGISCRVVKYGISRFVSCFLPDEIDMICWEGGTTTNGSEKDRKILKRASQPERTYTGTAG